MKKRLYIILIIVLGVLLGITSYNVKNNKLSSIEKLIKDGGTYIQKVFNMPSNYIKNKSKKNKELKNIYKKYIALKEKEDNINLYISKIDELEKEITELKKITDLNSTLSEYNCINATIVNRNIGYWYNNLTIDKGIKNGVVEGDAVMVPSGLIGKVVAVSNYSSTVRLLTTNEILNKISVKVKSKDNYLYGLLYEYNKEKNIYNIEGIVDPNIIEKGDIVTTTGLTDYFPGGIIIGKVSKIVKDEYDLNSIIEVTPSVDFNSISVVTVLNRKAKEE